MSACICALWQLMIGRWYSFIHMCFMVTYGWRMIWSYVCVFYGEWWVEDDNMWVNPLILCTKVPKWKQIRQKCNDLQADDYRGNKNSITRVHLHQEVIYPTLKWQIHPLMTHLSMKEIPHPGKPLNYLTN